MFGNRRRLIACLLLIIGPALGAVIVLTAVGSGGHHPSGAVHHATPVWRPLLALAAVLAVARVAGTVAGWLRSPRVVGEMAAGILLGPSLLGLAAPGAEHWLFGPQALPWLQALSNVGLALFMFLVGSEFHLPDTRGRGGTAVIVGLASIAVPLLSGILVSPTLVRTFGPAGVSRLHVALFVGVAMSVTAFPVLARILTERGVLHSPLGSLAIACAAVADIVAWVLLVGVVAVSHGGSPAVAARSAVLSGAFLLAVWFVVRPLLASLFRDGRRLPDGGELAIVAAGILVCAAATDAIGIHLIFGAFLFGAAFPRGNARLRLVADRIEPLTSALLLPLFFALVGLQTDFTAIGDGTLLLWALPALLGIAFAGKWAATAGAGRLLGLDGGTSHRLGALMACKGLTELVVLSVGRDLGLLSPRLFSLLVLVALAATAATAPALDLLDRRARRRTGSAQAAWTIGWTTSAQPQPQPQPQPHGTAVAVTTRSAPAGGEHVAQRDLALATEAATE